MSAREHAQPAGGHGPLRYAESALPGAAIGVVGGAFAAVIAAAAGLGVGATAIVGAALGVPLALLGGGYCVLLAAGRVGVGAVGPAVLYWVVGFPLARLVHELAMAQALHGQWALREPLPQFLLFQAMLSVGFAIGFLWLHERVAPYWLLRIRAHNRVAERLVERYVRQAAPSRPGGHRPS